MATNQNSHKLEIEQCLHIMDVYLTLHHVPLCRTTVEALLHTGDLQVSSIFEKVSAYFAGCDVIQEDEADLSNGADCKMVSVRTASYGRTYSAPVTSIKNKTGTLYVYVYERKRAKHYYFAIPYWAHSQVGSSSNIEIPFDIDGSPRKNPRGPKKLPNWWDFECKSLEEMCQFPGKDT